MGRVLVLSPHPDDEAIGCGGSLCRHIADGDSVHVVFLTSGEAGGHGMSPEQTARIREGEARRAAAILGVDQLSFLHLPDGALRATKPVCARIAALLKDYRPDLVYAPHAEEAHPDHRAAPRILKRALALRPCPRPRVRLFEVWTPLARMDHIEDISPYIARKLDAVRAYASQCAILRFDEAVAGLNRYRGEMHSWPDGDYAEVFVEMAR